MNIVRTLAATGAFVLTASAAAALPLGWTAVGNADYFTPNGVITALPGITGYTYVSTDQGIDGVGSLPGVGGVGNATNGSTLTTSAFSASAGSSLEFNFNFVTSDGAGYADYAWARILNVDTSDSILLFTARTTPAGDTVPGFSMPALADGVSLTPSSTPIIGGGPVWDQLGGSSGACYDAGCGYTGWIKATYEFAMAGNFQLQFGVTNWNDQIFDSGMAIAGTTIDGAPIDPSDPVAPIPLPAASWLLLGGLGALTAVRRRKRVA